MTKTLMALFTTLFLSMAGTALAQDASTLFNRGVEVYNQGVDEAKEGRFAAACQSNKTAAVYFNNAIYALMSQPMSTDEQRENVKYNANAIQSYLDTAEENAKAYCNTPDRVTPVTSPQSSAPSGPDIQELVNQAQAASKDALNTYEAGNPACLKGRKAVELWILAYDTLNNTPHADYGTVLAIKDHAETAIEYRDQYYCKGQ